MVVVFLSRCNLLGTRIIHRGLPKCHIDSQFCVEKEIYRDRRIDQHEAASDMYGVKYDVEAPFINSVLVGEAQHSSLWSPKSIRKRFRAATSACLQRHPSQAEIYLQRSS